MFLIKLNYVFVFIFIFLPLIAQRFLTNHQSSTNLQGSMNQVPKTLKVHMVGPSWTGKFKTKLMCQEELTRVDQIHGASSSNPTQYQCEILFFNLVPELVVSSLCWHKRPLLLFFILSVNMLIS